MAIAFVNPAILRWARQRAGLSEGELASHFERVSPSKIREWESGKSSPSISQAESLASKLGIPFLLLFKSEPPSLDVPIPDLRTVAGKRASGLSPNFFDVIIDCLIRQRWYRQQMLDEGRASLTFSGRFRVRDGYKLVARDISQTLGLKPELRIQIKSWELYLTKVAELAENAGIMVIRNGQVKHASRRPLDPDEFRGFALCDPIAPVVFINTKDVLPARIFTLLHELAHIWIGEAGISNPDPRLQRSDLPNEIERFCNAVAAEVLMPEEEFGRAWDRKVPVSDNILRVSRLFKVSKIAALIRAREAEHISFQLASHLIDDEYRAYSKASKLSLDDEEREGGPTFWNMFAPRSSRIFLSEVVKKLHQRRVSYLEAASLLGVRLRTLDTYLEKSETSR